MTLSNVNASWSLAATVTSTASQGTGTIVLGDNDTQRKIWTDANIVYALRLKGNGTGDEATLTVTTGDVVQDTGTPEITRWGTQTGDLTGNDFEGIDIPTMVTLYGMRVEAASGNGSSVTLTCSSSSLPDTSLTATDVCMQIWQGGITSPGTIQFQIAVAADIVDIVLIGKTT